LGFILIITGLNCIVFLIGYLVRDLIGDKPVPERLLYGAFLILFFFGTIIAALGLHYP
jgi:hypothetical protein